jgi:hypothetical protein
MHIGVVSFSVNLLDESHRSAVDAEVVNAREHEHLVAGFLAHETYFAHVHVVDIYNIILASLRMNL